MSDERKPWAEPGLSVEERSFRVLNAIHVDYPESRVRIVEALRAARADAREEAREEAATLLDRQADAQSGLVAVILRAGAAAIRVLKDRP